MTWGPACSAGSVLSQRLVINEMGDAHSAAAGVYEPVELIVLPRHHRPRPSLRGSDGRARTANGEHQRCSSPNGKMPSVA